MRRARIAFRRHSFLLVGAGVLAGLLVIARHDYLVFHSLVELSSIVVGWGIFTIAWNARRYFDSNFFVALGVGFLFVGAIDLLHTLAYKGMGVFAHPGSNLATQLWIAGRYMQGLSFLLALLFIKRRVAVWPLLAAYSAVLALTLLAIFQWHVFPTCFDDSGGPQAGLTPFKKINELVIVGILALGLWLLRRGGGQIDPRVRALIAWSVAATIAAELSFILYGENVFGLFNELGHFLKLISVYLLYEALISIGLRKPFSVLFRGLKKGERELRRARDELEVRVRQRTGELAQTVELLQQEVHSRILTEEQLRQSEERYRQLVELMPAGIFVLADDKVAFANPACKPLFGAQRVEDLVGKDALDLVHPDSRDFVRERLRHVLQHRQPAPRVELKFLRLDGTAVEVESTATPIVYQGKPAIQGMFHDITERKRAEGEALAERQKLFAVLNMLPGYVKIVGRDHSVRFANHRYVDLFGAPAGRPCHEVQFGRGEPCEHCPSMRVLQTKRPADWEWTSPAGRTYMVRGYPFVETDGAESTLSLGIDITEQRDLERRVIEAGERERRRIGRDLHDTLGQNLTGLAFLIKGLARDIAGQSPRHGQTADQVVKLVNESISQVRSIARGLDPVGIHEEGLAASLREMADGAEKLFHIRCRCHCDDRVLVKGDLAATNLYHIAQEAVNNAVKHANARQIDITVKQDARGILLAVADDGVGMPPDLSKTAGLGLHTMRYRANMIGASLRVGRNGQGGTVVTCSLPAPQEPRREQEGGL